MGRVVEKCGGLVGEDILNFFVVEDFVLGLEVGGVEFGVDLVVGFDEVEGSD